MDVDRVRSFRESWTYAPTPSFCENAGWIASNPALALKAPQTDVTPTLPFSDDEISAMLIAADSFWPRGHFREGIRQRIKAMILLLRYSGLRISDAACLERSRLNDNRLFLYTQKTGTPVWIPLPQIVVAALRKCPNANEAYVFWNGTCLRTNGRPGGPPDDQAREQIHDDGQVEPMFAS